MSDDLVKRLRYGCIDCVTGERLDPGSRADVSVEDASEAADEIERLQADAARYRWLRDVSSNMYKKAPAVFIVTKDGFPVLWKGLIADDALDAAIDVAMKEKRDE